jgi:replicative DNA helicase
MPGSGKTALAMQLVVEALRHTDGLRALYACCEMTAAALLDRQLARLSGIDAETIRTRAFTDEHAERLGVGLATIEGLAGRLAFLDAPFTLENVAAAGDTHEASVLVVDYIQRFSVGKTEGEGRVRMNAIMDELRKFASGGYVVVVLSAVGRQKDSQGRSSYADLNLASFRESSELEFGCDAAYIVAPLKEGDASSPVRLACVKNRHGPMTTVDLAFDRAHQSFTLDDAPKLAKPTSGRRPRPNKPKGPAPDPALSTEALAAFWASTPAAADDPDTDTDEVME